MVKKSKFIKILPFFYILSVYIFLITLLSSNRVAQVVPIVESDIEKIGLILPFVLGLINLIFVVFNFKNLDVRDLFDSSMLIKYALIPFYMFGGLVIFLFILCSLIPLPFLMIIGPTATILLSLMGWGILIGEAPFSVGYFIKAYKEGKYGRVRSFVSSILQFFFFVDVVLFMMLGIRDDRWKRITKIIIGAIVVLVILSVIRIIFFIGYKQI